MKVKILSKLPSTEALRMRIDFLKDKIRKCEGEIPVEFWCDDCKRLLQKIENLEEKKKIIEEESLAYKEAFKTGTHLGDGSFTSPTPTFKYRCSHCGRVFVNDEHLWPPLGVSIDSDKKLRCYYCSSIVEEIKPSRK
ncbi:MAG: hypothetical protein KAW92_10680 [Candidatus Cloacimonetes bacterium]|nr:hypothetical protein [Candidatus Cloacimonadota bacterium]